MFCEVIAASVYEMEHYINAFINRMESMHGTAFKIISFHQVVMQTTIITTIFYSH